MRLIGVAAGTVSRWWESVENDDNNVDRLDLSLKSKQFMIFFFSSIKISHDRVVGKSVFIAIARYFSSFPSNISSTSFARNNVKFVGNDDSEQP